MIRSLAALLIAGATFQVPQNERVSSNLTSSGHFLRPIGKSIVVSGRPVDMAIHPNGKWAYIKENRGLTVVDVASWKVIQELGVSGGASHTGIALDESGSRLFFSNAASTVHWGSVNISSGLVKWEGKLAVPKPKIGGEAFPCGIVLGDAGDSLYVASSRGNEVFHLNAADGEVLARWETDIAPYDVAISQDEDRLYVSCWGGRRPKPGTKTATSAGTPVEIDDRGIVKGASVAVHDTRTGKYNSFQTGLQPSEIVILKDGRAMVANANHDSLTEIDSNLSSTRTVVIKPNLGLPVGSAPSALALDGDRLYVACGGSNAVSVVSISGPAKILGFIPTGWYPASVAVSKGQLLVGNAKGIGSRRPQKDGTFGVYNFTGTLQKVDLAALGNLETHTAIVNKLNATPTILQAFKVEASRAKTKVPIPVKLGDPSVIEHVVYVIKENRTYDQVFGDMKKGDGDPKLCIFGRRITPNQHALVEQFVLLDNYYCNGINSADGHAWSTEANASSHFERSFGGWTRSYPFGDDPISTSSSGFVWDNVLKWGKTFRNYGEYDYAEPVPKTATWKQIYEDWKSGANKIKFTQNIGVDRLRRYSQRSFPGWNMRIPDVLRASVFIKDVQQYKKAGYFPNLTILFLPQDHTSGTEPGEPTPRATVADNDLALGQCVEALSKTQFWKKMAIFVIEDDPQAGFDHIDGHRSTCLVISPYARRSSLVSKFYNQTSVLATMQRILGVPPLNQMDARSPIMFDCFTSKANFATYRAKPNLVPLDELNPPKSALKGEALKWAEVSENLPRHKPDLMNASEADQFNRALWFSVKGSRPYPTAWAGSHGRGLKKRGLVTIEDDD
ncbi:MAG: bifunctional YncE family protein/alkaline phosphatase family protein [Chlorobia bacterium]|nr:bifunctional YncE family protein/alkaline phosphatase family protein [Fimbriimonadaceae bacterium]